MAIKMYSDKTSCFRDNETGLRTTASEALYRQAIENADGGFFILIFGAGPGEGYFMNIGSGISQFIGIRADELTERGFYDMIEETIPLSDNIPSDIIESREKFISGELTSFKAEILIKMPEGEKKWILYSALPLNDDETGKVIGTFGILFNINKHKRILEFLRNAKEKAEQNDRLKSAFISNISHEIRTPLNAIVGFSTLLCQHENDPARQQEYMNFISQSSDHLLEIVDGIVEISNIEANNVHFRKEGTNLNSVLGRVHDRFREKAFEKGNSLLFAASTGYATENILTDGFKLFQILSNLLSNAMKFTKNGKIEFGYKIKENAIQFFVSDTGIGIEPEHRVKIFDPFFQVESSSKRRYEGTGVGLSISKAYVEMLGGEIWLTSQPGEGSVFNFTIPYEKAD